VRAAYTLHSEDDDQVQARALWTKVLSPTDREHLVSNIVGHLKNGVEPLMVQRVVEYWRNVHQDLGDGVARGLGLRVTAGTLAGD